MIVQRSIAEVAALVGGTLDGDVEGAADRRLEQLLAPERAGPADIAPLFGSVAVHVLQASRAGCVLAGRRQAVPAVAGRCVIRVDDADRALDVLVSALVPAEQPPEPGVHATAVVEPGAQLGAGVAVGALVFVGRGARVGQRTRLWPGVHVGAQAVVGTDGDLRPHVVLGARCVLGERVLVHPGAVIGSDGFGFRQDREGRHHKIPQLGIVVVGDDVEIGANCTIDRARFEETRIGNGCKLDNLVHLAHNVELGEHCALAATVGIAGSTTLGARVLIGGHTGVKNAVHIGDGAIVGGCSGVTEDVPAGSFVVGFPAVPHKTWARAALQVRRLGELAQRVTALEAGLRTPSAQPGPAPHAPTQRGPRGA